MMSSLIFISLKLLFFNRPKVHKIRKPYIHLNDKEIGVIRIRIRIGMKEMNASYREIGVVIGRNHESIQFLNYEYEQSGDINRKIGS